MEETTADRLAIAATQLEMLTDRILKSGVTAEDLASVAAYLIALTEHGCQVASLAVSAAENTDAQHPIRAIPHGTSAAVALLHSQNLFHAGIHFAGEADHNLRAMHSEDI
jgi:hypothetical protein